MKPLISIIIPFYQKKNYLEQTIKSIAKQSQKNFELIFVYDDPDKSDLPHVLRVLKRTQLIHTKLFHM